MTKEDFEKIEEMIEDGVWRVLAFVALMLGHYWTFGIFLVLPLVGRGLKYALIHWRIAKAEDKLKALNSASQPATH